MIYGVRFKDINKIIYINEWLKKFNIFVVKVRLSVYGSNQDTKVGDIAAQVAGPTLHQRCTFDMR